MVAVSGVANGRDARGRRCDNSDDADADDGQRQTRVRMRVRVDVHGPQQVAQKSFRDDAVVEDTTTEVDVHADGQ